MDGRRIRRTTMLECWMEEAAVSVAYVPAEVCLGVVPQAETGRGGGGGRSKSTKVVRKSDSMMTTAELILSC